MKATKPTSEMLQAAACANASGENEVPSIAPITAAIGGLACFGRETGRPAKAQTAVASMAPSSHASGICASHIKEPPKAPMESVSANRPPVFLPARFTGSS